MEAVAGVTEMAVSVAPPPPTVRTALPNTLPEAALIVEVPASTALASPVPLTVATARLLLDQVTTAVQSALAPFE
jgi:hypothetical protein